MECINFNQFLRYIKKVNRINSTVIEIYLTLSDLLDKIEIELMEKRLDSDKVQYEHFINLIRKKVEQIKIDNSNKSEILAIFDTFNSSQDAFKTWPNNIPFNNELYDLLNTDLTAFANIKSFNDSSNNIIGKYSYEYIEVTHYYFETYIKEISLNKLSKILNQNDSAIKLESKILLKSLALYYYYSEVFISTENCYKLAKIFEFENGDKLLKNFQKITNKNERINSTGNSTSDSWKYKHFFQAINLLKKEGNIEAYKKCKNEFEQFLKASGLSKDKI